jgi:hypothetical protein
MNLERPSFVGRVIYGTIALTSVLVVYDGWAHLRGIEVAGVIIGPVVAMFLSHVFAGSLAWQVAQGRGITGAERRRIVAEESRFLLLAVPPLVLVGLFSLFGLTLQEAIRNTVTLEALSLGFWSGLAGWRTGMRGGRLALAVTAGLLMGAVVLLMQVLLQPGDAIQGGAI